MKKLLSLLLALTICLSFGACGKDEPETVEEAVEQVQSSWEKLSEENEKKKAEENKQFEKNQVKIKNGSFEIPDIGKVNLKSYVIMDGMLDTRNIVLTLEYTNTKADYDLSFNHFANYLTLYQDGAKLSSAFSSFDKEQTTTIKSGSTVEVVTSYTLRNETSDIEFECKDYNGEYGTYTLKLK